MVKLSIVIPVFGVEKFVSDCIVSCIENIGKSSNVVEVVVVDDGSKDCSIDIIQSIVKDIPYIRIISQKNQGLSVARNTGLENAKGDYVWFVDSDDILAEGIVALMLDIINRINMIDIFEMQYMLVREDIQRSSLPQIKNKLESYSIISGKEKFVLGFSTPVPFHIFRRAFLNENKLRMYPGIYHEDSEFTPRAVWLAKYVAVIPEVAYFYRQRRLSIMTTANPKKGENYLFISHRLQDFFDGQEVDSNTQKVINDYIAMTYCNGLHNVIGANKKDRAIIAYAAWEHRVVLHSLNNAIQIKYRILGFLGSLFPKRISTFYSIMMKFKK